LGFFTSIYLTKNSFFTVYMIQTLYTLDVMFITYCAAEKFTNSERGLNSPLDPPFVIL